MKTWFVLSLLKALSRGENVCGVPFWRTTVSGIKAVMVEGKHSTNALIQRVQQSLACTSNIVIPHRTGVKLLPKNPEFEDLLNFIDEFRPDLLVLDPLRSFFDGDENDKLKDSEVRLQKLAKLLTQRSYTQKELTDLLKVSNQTVRNDISKLRAGGFTIEEEGGHQGSPKTYTLTKTPDGWKADDEDSDE